MEQTNKKQSSVEWLIAELGEYFPHEIGGIELMVSKAKAMHKEEIVDSIVQYEIKHHLIFTEEGILNTVKKAEQYYKETYGGNNGK